MTTSTPVTAAQIQALYIAYFNRPADVEGLQFYLTAASNGVSLAQIASGFSGSPEYTNQFPVTAANPVNTVNYNAIVQLYQNLFGRTPALVEVQFWQNAANNGQVTLSGLALALFNGAQNTDGGSQDATIVANKLAAATAFTNSLTTTAEATGYSGVAANAVLKAWLSGITDDPATLAAATTDAQLTAESNLASAASSAATAVTKTLTSGIDTVTANVVNAIIDTTFGSTDSSLNSFDTVTGAAGTNNVFNLVSNGALAIPSAVSITNFQTANLTALGAVTVNTAAWSGLTTLNVAGSVGADTISAAGTTAINVVNTPGATATTIDGGSTVSLTSTGSNNTPAGSIGGIVIGGNTASTGAVSVNATKTINVGTVNEGGITVTAGGAVAITTNNSINAAVTTPGTISVAGVVGAVAVTTVDDIGFTGGQTTQAVSVSGGSSIVINETIMSSSSASGDLATLATGTVGAIGVTGDATTASVSITQTAANAGSIYVAAIAASPAVTTTPAVPATPGNSGTAAVVTPATAAVAAVAGVAAVVDAAVSITDTHHSVKSVSLANYGDLSTIAGTALTSLNLSGTAGRLSITNSAGVLATNTTLALTVSGLKGTDTTVTDANNEITTLNVTTGAAASTLTAFNDSALTTLNVSGSSVLTLSTVPASITTLTVTGAAGFKGDISGTGVTAFAPTGSGVITTTLNSTVQSFTGGAGQDIVTITLDATKAITGGSATNNEIVLLGNSTNFGAHTFANVTHFTTLGVSDAGAHTDVYDMSLFTGYKALDLITAAVGGSDSFTNVAAGTSLMIEGSAAVVNYTLAQPSSTASINLTLGASATNTVANTVNALALNDVNNDGIATLNLVSYDKTAGAVNTIATLTDVGLSTLNVTGNAGVTIGSVVLGNPGQTVPVGLASLAISNNSTGTAAVTITSLTDDTLGSLSVSGTGTTAITSLTDNNAVFLNINNTSAAALTVGTLTTNANANDTVTNGLSHLTFSGTAAVNVGTLVDAGNTAAITISNAGTATDSITAWIPSAGTSSVTVNGNITLGTNTNAVGTPITFANTTGVTLAAGTDHAHINVVLTGAAAGNTDIVTVGNGNDRITDNSTLGSVTVSVGTGSNLIDVHNAAAGSTGIYTINLGTHTAPDSILTSVVAAIPAATGANTVITGAVAGDLITLHDNAALIVPVALTATQVAQIASGSTLAAEISTAHTMTGAHGLVSFVFGGNTYLVEDVVAGTAAAATSSVIELVGVHTVAATAVNGQIHLVS